MKTLVVLTSLALLLVVAVAGVALYQERRFNQSPEGIAVADVTKAENRKRDDIQSRVDALAVDGCSKPALAILALHRVKPIATRADIPATLLEDMRLCIERGIMHAYVRDQLDDTGILVKL